MTLEVHGLVAGYSREAPILKGVEIVARQGLATVIIGPNGAGKSTLLRAIYGYLRPIEGEILHDGESINGLSPERMLGRGIGYLLQGRSIFPAMTVAENLELGGWMLRHDRGASRARSTRRTRAFRCFASGDARRRGRSRAGSSACSSWRG